MQALENLHSLRVDRRMVDASSSSSETLAQRAAMPSAQALKNAFHLWPWIRQQWTAVFAQPPSRRLLVEVSILLVLLSLLLYRLHSKCTRRQSDNGDEDDDSSDFVSPGQARDRNDSPSTRQTWWQRAISTASDEDEYDDDDYSSSTDGDHLKSD